MRHGVAVLLVIYNIYIKYIIVLSLSRLAVIFFKNKYEVIYIINFKHISSTLYTPDTNPEMRHPQRARQ